MTPADTGYSTFDRELVAVYLVIKHFRSISLRCTHTRSDVGGVSKLGVWQVKELCKEFVLVNGEFENVSYEVVVAWKEGCNRGLEILVAQYCPRRLLHAM